MLEQIVSKTRPKVEEPLLVVMDKSVHEEHLSHTLQTNDQKFKIAVNFFIGCNGIFNVTTSQNKLYFAKSTTDKDGFFQITIPPGAYETESLDIEFSRIVIDEEHYTEANYPFNIKANF